MITNRKAEFYLIIVTAIWGLTFPLVGNVVKTINPLDFVCFRFLLAALIMFPFVIKDFKDTTILTLMWGAVLGILNLVTYWSQSVGLKTLSSGESAFITSTSVILVPFILLFFRNKPTISDFLCALICLFGLYILTGTHLASLSFGELLTLVCAISTAFTIIFIQIATHQIKKYMLIAFYQILFTGLFAIPFSVPHETLSLFFNPLSIFALLYCSIMATVIVFYLQVKYQKYTTSSKAALIFCAEPLFACLYSLFFFNEKITLGILIGGAFILASMILPEIIKIYFKNNLIIRFR